MANALIITENYLKQNSVVNENCDMKTITPTIVLVQDMYILPLLGSSLYNEILTQINASTAGTNDAVSALNITLLNDHVLKCVLWYTLCEMTPSLKYRYMNKGVMVKNSENSSAADLQEIQFLMDKWKNNAEMYADRCKNYLIQESTSYPLYNYNPDLSDIQPTINTYTSGLYLEDGYLDCDIKCNKRFPRNL